FHALSSTMPHTLPLCNLQLVLTSPWLLSLGVTAAVIILAIAYGIVRLTSRKGTEAVHQAIGDGLLTPLTYVAGAFVLLAVGGLLTMPWQETLESLQRLPIVGPDSKEVSIPAGEEDFAVAVDFRADELEEYAFSSDQN